MNEKKRNLIVAGILISVTSAGVIGGLFVQNNLEISSIGNVYSIILSKDKNKVNAGSGIGIINSELNNQININYSSIASYSSGWALIKSGGFISTTIDESSSGNTIREMSEITFSFPDASMFASLNIYLSIDGTFNNPIYKTYTVKHNEITFDLGGHARYIKIESLSSNLYINQITLKYNCGTYTDDEAWYKNRGILPVFNRYKTEIMYGLYPSTTVTNSRIKNNLINKTSTLIDYQIGDYLWFESNYYVEGVLNEKQTFFQCSSIRWNIVSKNDDIYELNCLNILNASTFSSSTSDYSNSVIRNFLINDFYHDAFFLNSSYILPNDAFNNDKVYISEIEEISSWYSELPNKITKKPSNYAISKGVESSSTTGYGEYWTRSINEDNKVKFVNQTGETTNTKNTSDICGISPTIKIKIQ